MSGGPSKRVRQRRARARRLFAGAEAELVPQGRLSGPMPWVIAIMVALTAIALATGLALGNTVTAATAEIEGGVTVQLVEPRADVREREAARALDALKVVPGVASMRLVPQEELDALVAPWLGSSIDTATGAGIPVPALIDVRLQRAASPERVAAIQRAVTRAAPSARVARRAHRPSVSTPGFQRRPQAAGFRGESF